MCKHTNLKKLQILLRNAMYDYIETSIILNEILTQITKILLQSDYIRVRMTITNR